MVALTANRAYKLGKANIATLPADSLTAKLGSLIGFNSATGYAVLWTGAADVTFAGVCVKAVASASTVMVRCDSHTIEGYQRVDGVSSSGGILVSGVSAVTNGEAAVYSATDNIEDATLTATAGPAIGYVERVINTSTGRCHVRLLPRGYSVSRGALDFILPDNVAAALDIREGSTSYMTFVTTDSGEKITIAKAVEQDVARTTAGSALDIDLTFNAAAAAGVALDVSAAQITTNRTSSTLTAIKAAVTSLSGDTAGVDYYAFEAAVTAGEATADHFAFKVGAGFDQTIDASSCATTESGWMVGANLADAWHLKTSALTFSVLRTTTAAPGFDETFALTGAGAAHTITTTANHATAVINSLEVSVAQITTARTAGSITAVKSSITSLTGTTAGVDHIAFEAACTAGDADSDHIVLKQGANFNRTIDASAAATAEAGALLPANVAAAWTVKEASLTFEVLKTTTATPGIDWTFALTGAEQALHLTTTANLASGAISGLTSQITTVTTNHTAGVIAAFKASITSLVGDTGGDFCAMHIVSVDGGGTTPIHSGIYCDDPLDAFLKVAATGDGSVVVGNMTAKNPESDTEAGYFSILVGSTRYEVPMYAVA